MSSQNIQALHISILGLQPGVSELSAAGFYPAWFLERNCSLSPCVFPSSFSSWTSSSFLARKSPTCWKKNRRNLQIAALHNVLQHTQASSLRCLSWISWLSCLKGWDCAFHVTWCSWLFLTKQWERREYRLWHPLSSLLWDLNQQVVSGSKQDTYFKPRYISVLVQSSKPSPSPQRLFLQLGW